MKQKSALMRILQTLENVMRKINPKLGGVNDDILPGRNESEELVAPFSCSTAFRSKSICKTECSSASSCRTRPRRASSTASLASRSPRRPSSASPIHWTSSPDSPAFSGTKTDASPQSREYEDPLNYELLLEDYVIISVELWTPTRRRPAAILLKSSSTDSAPAKETAAT